MSSPVTPKKKKRPAPRPYRSPLRANLAEETRRRILDAALDEMEASGPRGSRSRVSPSARTSPCARSTATSPTATPWSTQCGSTPTSASTGFSTCPAPTRCPPPPSAAAFATARTCGCSKRRCAARARSRCATAPGPGAWRRSRRSWRRRSKALARGPPARPRGPALAGDADLLASPPYLVVPGRPRSRSGRGLGAARRARRAAPRSAWRRGDDSAGAGPDARLGLRKLCTRLLTRPFPRIGVGIGIAIDFSAVLAFRAASSR